MDEELVDAVKQVASALRRLGTADAASPMGAIEVLSVSVKEAGDAIAGGLHAIAEAITARAD